MSYSSMQTCQKLAETHNSFSQKMPPVKAMLDVAVQQPFWQSFAAMLHTLHGQPL